MLLIRLVLRKLLIRLVKEVVNSPCEGSCLNTMNRQLLDLQGPIPGMTTTQALTAIQTMADHSQKWHDETSSMNISSNSDTDGLVAVISILDNLGQDMKKLKENVHAI
ncbi:hypothetical protein Tco_0760833 [Tanacetum coccineum]